MDRFLDAIAPQLADLLRAAADYLDATVSEVEDNEDDLAPPLIPQLRINERGEVEVG